MILSCFKLILLLILSFHIYINAKDRVIKTYSDSTVYVLTNGTRHAIPDWNTFLALGYDANDIKTLTDNKVLSYPIGEPAKYILEERTIRNPYKNCPCVSQATYYESTEQLLLRRSKHLICFIDNENYKRFLFSLVNYTKLNIHHKAVPSSVLHIKDNFTTYISTNAIPELLGCDIVINMIPEDTIIDKYICPENCKSIPYTEIKYSWLFLGHFNKSDINMTEGITCSMTFNELFKDREFSHHYNISNYHRISNGYLHLNHTHSGIGLFLKIITQRRYEECNEQHLWPSVNTIGKNSTVTDSNNKLTIPPRKVFGFIIWVGSRNRLYLIHRQIRILANQSDDPDKRIMGWLATDDQYDCRIGSTSCYDVSNSGSYYNMMPTTRLNIASSGWACAQRRVLRAIAHTLLLYDPQFMIVADDDTYVNIDKLSYGGLLDRYIRNQLVVSNLVLGELTMGKKVTKRGFYYGGAGYLFGRKIISELTSYRIKGPYAISDDMRDSIQTSELSILKQVLEQTSANKKYCNTCLSINDSNIKHNNLIGISGNLTVRLIDICTNIMAQEHTCYHSDHAMSRCLLHGAHGYPLAISCIGTDLGNNLILGMCMNPNNYCGKEQLTCHRYYADKDNPHIAKGIYN